MARRHWGRRAVLGLLGVSGAAWACADASCYPSWKLFAAGTSCENRAFLAPGNDTRTNLLFLLRDRNPSANAGAYPEPSWYAAGYGKTFLDPQMQREGFYPLPKSKVEDEFSSFSGTRCASFSDGTEALKSAMAANRALPASEREALLAARMATGCGEAGKTLVAPAVSSAPGRDFLAYIRAADGFYAGKWSGVQDAFAAAAKASDPWLREAGTYMIARATLAEAQDKAFGEYGDFDSAKVDKTMVAKGQSALSAYLKAYPQGRYNASARGLLRRGMWLAGDHAALAQEYARLLQSVDPASPAAAELVQEIDNKLLFNPAAEGIGSSDPMLLATLDLLRMRAELEWNGSGEVLKAPSLDPASLAGQAPVFASQPDLYSFLNANAAFYLQKDYRRVLQLVPDDAKRPVYSNLAFSRQVLRGQALAALGDRNEASFWLELMGGAKGLWQRSTVELGLAMNWERHGKLALVFAKDSPISESMIRRELLLHSAGQPILRSAARDAARPQVERELALFTLLYKQLSRGDYAGFVADQPGVPRSSKGDSGMYSIATQEVVPVGLFARGRWSDGYPCGPIVETARKLAASPQDVPAQLCLGDFWRLNGFDDFSDADTRPKPDELGGYANEFPGKPLPRSTIYASVIADPRSAPGDKAYALYRSVMCYAPSGYNGCGGKEADKVQRKAWFDQLRRDYPASPWAKKLRYYW